MREAHCASAPIGGEYEREIAPVGAWAEPRPTVNATAGFGSALYPMTEPWEG